MSRRNDVGESVASINARADDMAWPVIESALRDGAHLYRPYRLRDYATRGLPPGDRRNGRMLTRTRVRKLEAAGVLRVIGVDQYGLVPK